MKSTLFARIMIRLCLPLLALGAMVTAVQLTSQLSTVNEITRLESRFALEAIHQKVSEELNRIDDAAGDTKNLRKMLHSIAEFYHAESIEMVDMLTRRSVFRGDDALLNARDHEALEESLKQRKTGKTYYVRIDKESKRLIGYIPFERSGGTSLWAVKASFSLANANRVLSLSKQTLFLMMIFIILTGVIIGRGLAKSIVKPIQQLNQATREVIKGNLGAHVNVRTGDEIEMLADTFNRMSDAMKDMKQRAEDANPLTALPGNHGIMNELKKRLHERQKFVFFHIDLDRFKVFNDHFGLARGDTAIKKTADALKKALTEKGGTDDFIGHQGGDDFVMITTPRRAEELAKHICNLFDNEVRPGIYRKSDLDLGYTEHMDRRHMTETGETIMRKFPLLSVSIAGVSNSKRDFADYAACMNLAVEVKKEVKKVDTSNYLIQE